MTHASSRKRGYDRRRSEEAIPILLCVIDSDVLVDRATRSTSEIHDHDKHSEKSF
jgi:hypothetical protein